MKISVIIPVFNEEKTIGDCLKTITNQTLKPNEIIIIDDGSNDNSKLKISSFATSDVASADKQNSKFKIFKQNHKGPAHARNLGASQATGNILVFVDSDMTFDEVFLEKLTQLIREKRVRGTFTKDEKVSNWKNVWARCWNFNQNIFNDSRIDPTYPDKAPVFRAILKKEFDRVGGFDSIGYTDDWTLSRKLGYQAVVAPGAFCYHKNPDNLSEVFIQARWIGKNEFLTGTFMRKIINLGRFSLPISLSIGLIKSIYTFTSGFIIFKLVYDMGVFISILGSFINESKHK